MEKNLSAEMYKHKLELWEKQKKELAQEEPDRPGIRLDSFNSAYVMFDKEYWICICRQSINGDDLDEIQIQKNRAIDLARWILEVFEEH